MLTSLTSAKIAFAQAAPELLNATIEALMKYPQRPGGRPVNASGDTVRRIREEHGDDFVQIVGPPHVQALITGRGPTGAGASAGTTPLHELLEQWAKSKPGFVLRAGSTYRQFGYAAAYNIHKKGTLLYQEGQPSRIFSDILSPSRLATIKARAAAGAMVDIATELRKVVAEHQRAAVDAQVAVHDPLAVLCRVPRELNRAEGSDVEVDRRLSADHGQVGHDAGRAGGVGHGALRSWVC